MPKYRVKEKSLVGNEIHEAGAIVDYDGLPAENLEPMDAEGEAKYQEYLVSNEDRKAAQKKEFGESAVGSPQDFFKALAKDREEQATMIAQTVGTAVAEAFARLFPNGIPGAAPAAPVVPAPPAPAAKPAKGSADKAPAETDSLV